jgi:primosomal protein N' (replication factor Y)
MPIIRVALDVPVNTLFDYLAPNEVTGRDVGLRVRVPFGKNILTGVIMEVMTHSAVTPQRLRHASHVFRDALPLPKDLLDLFRFCSEYYHHPLGEVVMNGLPTRLRSNKPFIQKTDADSQYRLTSPGQSTDLSAIPARSIVKRRLLARMQGQGEMRMSEAREISSRAIKVIKEFIASGWVEEIPVSHASDGIFHESGAPPVLTAAQKSAVDAIAAKTSEFKVWLLHGITGSGKTEVYLRLISPFIEASAADTRTGA